MLLLPCNSSLQYILVLFLMVLYNDWSNIIYISIGGIYASETIYNCYFLEFGLFSCVDYYYPCGGERGCGFSVGKLHCVRLLQSSKGARVAWSLFLLALKIGSEQESASQTGRQAGHRHLWLVQVWEDMAQNSRLHNNCLRVLQL